MKTIITPREKLELYQNAVKNAKTKKERVTMGKMVIHYKVELGDKLTAEEKDWYNRFVKSF